MLVLTLMLLPGAEPGAAQISRSFGVASDSLTPARIKKSLSENVKGYRIGVALSGGGARGFAHIGILKALEAAGIEIDLVAGTSMGGIVGGLYSLGMTPDEIRRATEEIDWSAFFSDRPQRSSQLLTRRAASEGELLTLRFNGVNPRIPTAISSGQKLLNILNSLTQIPAYFSRGDFSNLDRRLAIVSTDIVSGEKVVFTSGSLVNAMRATTGVPLAFTPFEDGDRLLMDGGLLDPIPTDEVSALGADFIIAANTTSNLMAKEAITDAVDIANQTTTILSAPTQKRLLALADMVITPELGNIKATDFGRIEDIIAAGRQAVDPILDSLRSSLEHFDSSYELHRVDSVLLVAAATGDSAGSIADRLNEITGLAGRSVTKATIDQAVYGLHQSGEFASVSYDLTHIDGREVLRLEAVPLPQVSAMVIKGNNVFSDSVLYEISGFDEKPVRSLQRLVEVYQQIIDYYREGGYDLMQIRSAAVDPKTGVLVLGLDEGRIVGISVEGNETTRAWAVTSYFPLRVGQFYSKFKANRGVQNIYASGLFENVSLQLSEHAGGVWIKIIVKEKDFTYAKIGARYHEDFHPESYLTVGYANIGGTGNELSLYTRFSEKRKEFYAQLRADRIFRTMVTYRIRAYYKNDKISQFVGDKIEGHRTDKRLGATISIGQQLARFGLFNVTARYESVRFSYSGEEPVNKRRVASLEADLQYDTKDRFVFATSGRSSQLSFELASDVLNADEVFQKFEGYIEAYHRIGQLLNFHPQVSVGVSKDGLPVYDQFYIGGSRSFMGRRTDELTGDKYFLTNLELRAGPFYRAYLSARYDMGEVFSKFEELRVNQLRHAFGFTLAFDTPLGPLCFSYGRAEGKYDNLYLNLGYDF